MAPLQIEPTIMATRKGYLCAWAPSGVVFVYLLLAASELSLSQADRCALKFPMWFGCLLGKHEGLAAGLIGTVGALIAAGIAWLAVQTQINSDKDNARWREQEALKAIKADLPTLLSDIDVGWRAIDEALQEEDRVVDAIVCLGGIAPKLDLSKFDEVTKDLAPKDRYRFRPVLADLSRVLQSIRALDQPRTPREDKLTLHLIRITLDDMRRHLADFDPELAAPLVERVGRVTALQVG